MKKIFIILIIVVVIIILGIGAYFLFSQKSTPTNGGAATGGQTGGLPTAVVNSSGTAGQPGYVGQERQIVGATPTGTYLSLGTAQGTVQVNNFYLSNPAVADDGVIIVKQTANYIISYDPSDASFWLAITGTPFATWQSAAEQDFLATLGVSEADACKLSVTSGVIYAPGNPNDGMSFPLSFCGGGAFQAL